MLRPASLALAVVAASATAGCGVQQRAAESLIDPQLRSEGVLVERQQGARDLELGRYRVVEMDLADVPFDGTGPLAPDADGRTRPTRQTRLEFSLAGGTTTWTAECVGQRRQAPDHELAAMTGDPRDEIAVRCALAGGDQTWTLELDGDLGGNLLGRLHAPGSPPKVVELLLWHRLWNITRRRLPAALALIRTGEGGGAKTEAALILDKPERAWLDPALDDGGRELALTAMLALRLLPLGIE
jgi:hypothetical protein